MNTHSSIVEVDSFVSACIQLGAFAHCLDLRQDQFDELMEFTHAGGSNRLEVFVLRYLERVVKRNATRTPAMGTASNSEDVFNWITTSWLSWHSRPSIIGTFYDPKKEAEKLCEIRAIKEGRRTAQINIFDLDNMNMAIQALFQYGVNLDICIDGQIPQRLANDGPTKPIFTDACSPEIVSQFEKAKQGLSSRFPASRWFPFIVFAIRLRKGESMQVPEQTLEVMKREGTLLSFIAEAYEETLKLR